MANFRFNNAWSRAAAADPRHRDKPAEPPPAIANADRPGPGPSTDRAGVGTPGRPRPGRVAPSAPSWGTWHARGAAVGGSRLTEAEVRAIRSAHAAGRGLVELARIHGVHRRTIHAVVSKEAWSHVR